MRNVKSDISHRVLAAVLAFMMIFNIMPLNIVQAEASTEGVLTTNIGEVDFVVGVPAEFTVGTTEDGEEGVFVKGSFTFSDPDAIAELKYFETAEGMTGWYDLTGDFGPATGFPVKKGNESKFMVTFNKAGEYEVTIVLKDATNGEALYTVKKTVVVANPSQITTTIPENMVVSRPTEFTVTTTANDDAGKLVKGYFEFVEGSAENVKIEYWETTQGMQDWYVLNGAFGPETGFPITEGAESKFRVTFSKSGEYKVNIYLEDVETEEVYCSTEATVNVVDASVLTTDMPANVDVFKAIEFSVTSVPNGDENQYVKGYFKFSDPEAIDKLQYKETAPGMEGWYDLDSEFGPATGFPLKNATSHFCVTFKEAGTYTAKIYLKGVNAPYEEYCATTVTVKVNPANITGVSISANKDLTYSGDEQELVTLSGVNVGDKLTWTVNDDEKEAITVTSTDDLSEYVPKGINAGPYKVSLTVDRGGNYKVLNVEGVEAEIAKAKIKDADISIESIEGLAYDGTEQTLVKLNGSFEANDIVTWTVNGTDIVSKDIPKKDAVGPYTVKLTVERENYEVFSTEVVDVEIGLGTIELGNLVITPNNRTYDTTEQLLLTTTTDGSYTLRYSLDYDKETGEGTWSPDIPKATDAGTYTVYVKAVQDSYNDKIVEDPVSVTIEKADIDIEDVSISAIANLTYNKEEQELVELSGVINVGDKLTWAVNDDEKTITVESTDDLSAYVPKGINAGTYKVSLTVDRGDNYNVLNVKGAEAEIAKAAITDISIEAIEGLAYNGEEKELVKLNGAFEENDIVTWTVNGTGVDIPKGMAVGPYTVKLTVNRGENYKIFECEVSAEITTGTLIIGDLTVKGLNGEYKGAPQNAVIVENQGEYTLKYQLDNGNFEVDENLWADEIPTVTDAGSYIVWVKAVKDSYNDSDVEVTPAEGAVEPYNVYVAKADQKLKFNDPAFNTSDEGAVTLTGPVPYSQEYDFSATAIFEADSITYEITEGADSAQICTDDLDAKGTVIVKYPGERITVKASIPEKKNYKASERTYSFEVKGTVSENGDYISFKEKETEYILGTNNGGISEQTAGKNNERIDGAITYSITGSDNVSIGATDGVVKVTDIDKLAEDIRNSNGTLKLTVTATKNSEDGDLYGADEVSYTINVKFGDSPAGDKYTLSEADPVTGWYNKEAGVTVTAPDGYYIAKEASGPFSESVSFIEEGVKERHIYLQNKETKAITDQLAVVDGNGDIKIDYTKPAGEMSIDFSDAVKEIGKLGFYKSEVTVTFTAKEDENAVSGISHFNWTYTRAVGASQSNVEKVENEKIAINKNTDGTFTATLKLPSAVAEQYYGNISFTVTDNAGNVSDVKTSDYTFVLDSKAPEMKVDYSEEVKSIGTTHYYDGNVNVTLTVTEANFDKNDVKVNVSKDGGEAFSLSADDVTWGKKDADDKSVGSFTLGGDGDYVVTVTYKDKSGNEMDEYKSETITIDTTKPVVKVSHDETPSVQKTTITVTEHNFRPEDAKLTLTATDIKGNPVNVNDLSAELAKSGNWTKNEDTYTFDTSKYKYEDGIYNLTLNYTDISGNVAEPATAKYTVDHTAPSDVTIEYVTKANKTTADGDKTYRFYKDTVTVKFTAYDVTSGIKSFTWKYYKEPGASVVGHPEYYPYSESDLIAKAYQDTTDKSKFTAEIELTAEEAEQFRGYISASATDVFENKGSVNEDKKNIIVVDNKKPKINVDYTVADRQIGDDFYYNNDIDVTLTVTEANFYAEDVVVKVTKNGEAFNLGTVTWGKKDAEDKSIGTFTLKNNGHYVVTVDYPDRSGNVMDAYTSKTHTIDTILPVIEVNYDDETAKVVNTLVDKDGNERNYYAGAKTATVTVTEHNFVSEEVEIDIVAKDVKGTVLELADLIEMSEWNSTGDDHVITIKYQDDANYSFDISYLDKANNAAEDYEADYFTVDATKPEVVEVEYTDHNPNSKVGDGGLYYKDKVFVTLTAEDETSGIHSFDYIYTRSENVSDVNAEVIVEADITDDVKYSEDGKTATVTFTVPKDELNAEKQQLKGKIDFTATDRSGNNSDDDNDDTLIIVDNISPTATVSYNKPVNTEGGVAYYDGKITATITINESNFFAEDVNVKAGSKVIKPAWTKSEEFADTYIGTFTLTEDGNYVVSINYKDRSGNEMAEYESKLMVIDTKIDRPTYTINGASRSGNGGAYKGKATIGFNFEDQNFDSRTIKLVRTRFDKVEDVTDEYINVASNDKGGSGSFSIPTNVENDGIYVLRITMTDKAHHETESELKFSINRFGSVYEYSDELAALIKDGGQFVTSVDDNLVITEYNADKLLAGSLQIIVTRDGEALDVDFTTNPANINSQVSVGKSGWYQYVYTIKASNFEKDGEYKISIISKYAASDSKENESASVPENSIDEKGNKITDSMGFTVDSVAPEIRNIVNLDQKIADVEKIVNGKLNVKYTIVDIGGIEKVEVIVNDKPVQTYTEDMMDDIYNFSGSFDLAEQDGTKAHKVRIRVTDLAGNVTDTDSRDFLDAHAENNENSTYVFFNEITVSRNLFVRWFANTGLFWGSVVGSMGLVGGVWYFIVGKKKKKEEDR